LRTLVESATDPALFAPARAVELKGLTGMHEVYGVRWEG
jgi:hypothetical protein